MERFTAIPAQPGRRPCVIQEKGTHSAYLNRACPDGRHRFQDPTMSMLLPSDEDQTCEGDLAGWREFSLAYYEPIQRALRLLRVPEGEVHELANAFLLQAAERDFLEKYRAFQQREAQEGRQTRFRTYLYRSLKNHVIDAQRRRNRRDRAQQLTPEAAEELASGAIATLDPDAIYALDVLHQALQALRRHCERTGKPHLWVIFQELLLADEIRGRKARTRQELLAAYPDAPAKFLDNSLTTAKRAFRRLIQDVVPRGLREGVPAAERFDEWMAILSRSNASQFNLLHLAYRVMPDLGGDLSQAASLHLVVDDQMGPTCYEEPSLVPDDDELSLLLSFRLERPLSEWLDTQDLRRFFPPQSPVWAPEAAPASGTTRPCCLLTLIEPTPEESEWLADVDLVGLLNRLKSIAKHLRRRPDHAMPEVFAQLLYTLVSVVALTRHDIQLHSIGEHSLANNVRWFLSRSWLDSRLQPLLESSLERLESGRNSASTR
jgi:hypothetical protein